jgi:hypothetical protein
MYKYLTLISVIVMHILSGTSAISIVTKQTKQLKRNHILMTLTAAVISIINTVILAALINRKTYC